MKPRPPLSQGNRLQRAYDRWAQPHYARMDPSVRAPVEAIDRVIYSPWGIVLVTTWLCVTVLSVLALRSLGELPWWLALLLSASAWVFFPFSLLAVWLQPDAYKRKFLKKLPTVLAMTMAGACLGFAAGYVGRHEQWTWQELTAKFSDTFFVLIGAALLTVVVMTGVMWALVHWRMQQMKRALAQARLESERDQAARQAADARLALLQAQIQPHFIFNTLSAVQHWVDTGDARGAKLLTSLTAFLRLSTDSMLRTTVPLSEEATMVRHYLAVMQERLGARLSARVDVAPDAATVPVPPGLLLTLVENAVEHGASPKLSPTLVHVTAKREGPSVLITVHDNGAGYVQGSKDGVGLSNARARLLQAHGSEASLAVDGTPGGGCTVRITLPLTQNATA
jgi:signal transduction histidine kinase